MQDDVAIKVENVYKNFKLPHEKVTSVKSFFVNPFQSRRAVRTETQHALKDISFEVKKGEFFGIVGRNGSGKSTLLKILAGIYQPTKGSIGIHGRLVPFIELGVGFNPELTGRDNVYLNGALMGFSTKEIDAMYDDIVEFAELKDFMDQKLKNYSSGMQVRLAFSVATRSKADILLIDEVLAVGDADFQRKCFNYFRSLKRQDTTVVFVSHDMQAVKEFCDRAIIIDENKVLARGKSTLIAQKYAELFITGEINDTSYETDQDRWGNGHATLSDVNVVYSSQEINVNALIRVSKTLGKIVSGIHIVSNDGQEIVAINNSLINSVYIEQATQGKEYSISWTMQNVFSDGQFSIMLTLVDQDGTVLDWLANAGNFEVKRPIRSVTPVLPPTVFSFKKMKG